MKKILIINGSPRRNGDTSYVLNILKNSLIGDITIFNTHFDDLKACDDCRYCHMMKGCKHNDDMTKLDIDSYDDVIILSPVFMMNLTPSLLSFISRLNYIWANKHFINEQNIHKKKKGYLILIGGGSGYPKHAKEISAFTFKILNAEYDSEHYLDYLKTDDFSIKDDNDFADDLSKFIELINN